VKSFSKTGVIASSILIPIDFILAVGMLFSYGSHWPSYWAWSFITVAFAHYVPAVLISIIAPKAGAYFLLFNAAVSLAIALLHLSTGHSLPTLLIHEPLFAFLNAGLIWGSKAWFIWLLLRHHRSDVADSILAGQSQR
jgi:hypothetical protein